MKLILSLIAGCLLLIGCSGTLQQDINTALIFEGQAQSAEQQLVLAAQVAIGALPADKQAAAQAQLLDIAAKVEAAFVAKDAALQAAKDAASSNGLNLPQLFADITAAIQALVALAQTFGADAPTTQAIGNRLVAASGAAK